MTGTWGASFTGITNNMQPPWGITTTYTHIHIHIRNLYVPAQICVQPPVWLTAAVTAAGAPLKLTLDFNWSFVSRSNRRPIIASGHTDKAYRLLEKKAPCSQILHLRFPFSFFIVIIIFGLFIRFTQLRARLAMMIFFLSSFGAAFVTVSTCDFSSSTSSAFFTANKILVCA